MKPFYTEQEIPMIAKKYPLVFREDFFKVENVYRIEREDGTGPIIPYIPELHHTVAWHELPHNLWQTLKTTFHGGQMMEPFNHRRLEILYSEGYVFGWRSWELMDSWVCGDDAWSKLKELGFSMKVYKPTEFYPLPDGQVMFKRP